MSDRGRRLVLGIAVLVAATACADDGQRAAPPDVQVRAVGCSLVDQLASGIVVADGYVLTVAHALRGASTVTVDGAPGVVVAVDPRIDAALIATRAGGAVATMTSSAAPEHATLDGRPVVVERSVEVSIDEPRDHETYRRSALVVDAQVTHGDSGSGVFGPGGEVLGMIFAASTVDPSVAYAVAASELVPFIEQHAGSSDAIGLGGVHVIELAACAEMLFLDLPFVERVRRIHELGFAVEMWGWADKDIAALAATGARFSSMTGYVHGNLVEADAAATMLKTAQQTVGVAASLGCRRLVVHPAELVDGVAARPMFRTDKRMWLTAQRTLDRLADLAERTEVTFCLENLNALVDHPGVPFAKAADTLALVASVDRPGVRLMLDLYHAQIGEGNLVALVMAAGDLIGEIQVADVPGRCEPGTGEIHYPAIARTLDRMGYDGTVGLEAYASGDAVEALTRFRSAFS